MRAASGWWLDGSGLLLLLTTARRPRFGFIVLGLEF
jgi:hypothetical protein